MKKIEKRTKRGPLHRDARRDGLAAGRLRHGFQLRERHLLFRPAGDSAPARCRAGHRSAGRRRQAGAGHAAAGPTAPVTVPGDTFVYRVGNATMREQVLTTTPDRVVWTNDQGLIWTTGYDLVSPMLSWSADPELGRGRQDIVDGNPASLVPADGGRAGGLPGHRLQREAARRLEDGSALRGCRAGPGDGRGRHLQHLPDRLPARRPRWRRCSIRRSCRITCCAPGSSRSAPSARNWPASSMPSCARPRTSSW